MTVSSPIRLNRERYAYLGRDLINAGCNAGPDNDMETSLVWGIQECGAHTIEFDRYPSNEFIYLLHGAVEIAFNDRQVERYSRGDCFLIPRDLPCTWSNANNVKKLYVVCDDQTHQNRFRLERIIGACYRQLVEHPLTVKKSC